MAVTPATGLFTLYRFFDSEETLLYVGLTVNPGRRMERHRNTKDWWSTVAHVAMEQHPSIEALRAAERAAIETERPLHNVRMNGGSMPPADHVEQIDGFVGRWFHSWELDDKGHKTPKWQGQITEAVGDGYFIQCYSWWYGSPTHGEEYVPLSEMRDWTFYRSSEQMQIALGCREDFGEGNGGRCNRPVTHRIKNEGGVIYACSRCIKFYGSDAEEI